MFFKIFTGLYNHHHNPELEHFVSPERNHVSISSHSPAPSVSFYGLFSSPEPAPWFLRFLVYQSTLCSLTILFTRSGIVSSVQPSIRRAHLRQGPAPGKDRNVGCLSAPLKITEHGVIFHIFLTSCDFPGPVL